MPSKTALDKYGQYLRAVTDPASIFTTIEEGKALSPMQQEVLDRIYPEYKAHLAIGLGDAMANKANVINPSAAKAGLGLSGSFSDGKGIGLLQANFTQAGGEKPVSKPMSSEMKDRNTVKFGLQD